MILLEINEFNPELMAKAADLLILDSMGELPWLYALADIAFVGGSMVGQGGHNPIEPAGLGIPTLFGRHMEDFSEISRDLVLAGALFSIAINPLVFACVPAMERWMRARPRLIALLEREGARAPEAGPHAALSQGGHAVVVGHGRVGSTITQALEHERLPFVVVERDRPRFDALCARGVPVVFGDATVPEILDASGIAHARLLILATPDSYRARRVLELAEAANPGIQVVVRTHSEDELARLRTTVNGHVVMGERELARTMLLYVLRQFGVPPERARRLAEEPSGADLAAEAERR